MSHLRQTLLAIALSTAVVGAWAQTDAEHKQHQAAALAAEQASAAPASSATTPEGAEKMAAMDSKMKAMHEMHQKMMSAKDPAEKKALMAEQMKTMHESMKMMGMMGGNGMVGMQSPKSMPASMNERQDMMDKRPGNDESLMQIMMDQMPPRAAR